MPVLTRRRPLVHFAVSGWERGRLALRHGISATGSEGFGLGQYEAGFRQNEVNETVLPKLTLVDLKEIGVGLLVIAG
jgi:hypothetical protein